MQDALFLCVFPELISVYPRVVSGVWVSCGLNVNYTWQANVSEHLASGSGAFWEDCGTLKRWDLPTGSESQGGVGLEALQAGSASC